MIQENTGEMEVKASPDKYTWYIKNYVGKKLASTGYTSMGGERMDSYGNGYIRLVLLTPNGEYIDIEDENSMKEWKIVGQSLEPNTELKYTYLLDEEGEEYDNLLAHQSIEEIVLALAPVSGNADVPEMTVINPSPDKYTSYIRDYTGRTLAQCGYISMSGKLCNAYGSACVYLNVCADDGSYVDFEDSSVLKNYVVTGQSVAPNTELTMTYMLDDAGKEYDNLIDAQNIEEIDLYVTRVNDYADTHEEATENVENEENTFVETAEAEENLVDGMRPDFKEAMDSYEAFEEWEEDEMNDAELKYYLDVNNRVMQKMLDVMQK